METRTTSALLYLDGVTVSFDGFRALNELSLAVEAGEVIFGEPDTRFTELVELLLDSVARMCSPR